VVSEERFYVAELLRGYVMRSYAALKRQYCGKREPILPHILFSQEPSQSQSVSAEAWPQLLGLAYVAHSLDSASGTLISYIDSVLSGSGVVSRFLKGKQPLPNDMEAFHVARTIPMGGLACQL